MKEKRITTLLANRWLLLLVWLIVASSTHANTLIFNSIGKLTAALHQAQPGDTLLLSNGVYKDVTLRLAAKGSKNAPIVVKAQNNGQVLISGQSALRISGEYIQVEGLYFKDGFTTDGATIEFRNAEEVANNCRLTQCAIDGYNPQDRSTSYSWIQLYGKHNRVDHNVITNKLHVEVTLAVILNGEKNQQNGHQIDHNWFGPRPIFGSNGAETIRVGTSNEAHTSSYTTIEHNYFEQCNGEVEVVSIKSSDNIVRHNTFKQCCGVLAFRHGDRNKAYQNCFYGDNIPNTGGIRVVNEGHTIEENLFFQLRGTRFFAPLALMNAVPNSLPNRYVQVKNIRIINNKFIDCSPIEFGVGRDNERTLPATAIQFDNNRILSKNSEVLFDAIDDISGYTFSNNQALYKGEKYPRGFIKDLTMNQTALLSSVCSVERDSTGASWYSKPQATKQPAETMGKTVLVSTVNELQNAIINSQNGDTVVLQKQGNWDLEQGLIISKKLHIKASKGLKSRPILRYFGTRRAPIFEINNGGSLQIESIAFDGKLQPGYSHAIAAIATANGMIEPYTLEVSNCEFYHFHESGFAAIRGYKSTFSEQITIKNSLFRDMSAEGINMAGEKEDIGRYNVENLTIYNCAFYNLLGSAINLYRGGNDESTSGPTLRIDHCSFVDICNREQGAAVRMIGAQRAKVTNCMFVNSGRGGASIRLQQMRSDIIHISHINCYQSGRIESFYPQAIKGNITHKAPRFMAPKLLDFRLQEHDPLAKKGSDKLRIGILTTNL